MVIDMSAKNSIGMEQHHYRGISTRRRFFKNNSNDLQINMKWLENLDSAWRQKWYSYFFACPLLAINLFFCLTPGRSLSVSLASTKTLFLASNEVQCACRPWLNNWREGNVLSLWSRCEVALSNNKQGGTKGTTIPIPWTSWSNQWRLIQPSCRYSMADITSHD